MSDIVALYADGLSCRDIGRALGFCDETIRKRLLAAGVKMRPKSHKKPMAIPSWEEYFLPRSEKNGACLLWTGFVDEAGYGRCNSAFAPDVNFAHRMSWFLKHGAFDLALRVLHRCDVRNCIEPAHLFLGTQADNVADMVQKKRQRGVSHYGEANPGSCLTETNVIRMRGLRAQEGIPYHKLADMFGVSTMTAYRACVGQSWTHL